MMFRDLLLGLSGLATACTQTPRSPATVTNPAPQTPAAQAKPKLLGWNPPCQPSRPPPRPDDPIVGVVAPAANRLIERVRSEPGYGGAWFENEPCYRVVLAFTDGQPRWSVIEAAELWLRPYIGFARSRFTEVERSANGEKLRQAMASAGISYAFGDGAGTESWTIYVGSQADVDRARALVPERYLPMTTFHIGIPVPRLERS